MRRLGAWLEDAVANRDRSGCWLDWPFYKSDLGYPRVCAVTYGVTLASHLVLILDGRPRPSARHEVGHSCDTPPCLNPAHLRWLTHAENQAEMAMRGRSTKGQATVYGEMVGNHKLTEWQVRDIRRRYRRGVNQFDRGNAAVLAREFSVTMATICHITKGATWVRLQ